MSVHGPFDDIGPSLFDDEDTVRRYRDDLAEHDEAVVQRDRAIEKAERGADPLWFEEALAAIEHCARAEAHLTSEDVAALIGRSTHEPRALGAVFRVAKDKGWITPSGVFVPATHPTRHCAPIRVWESNLYIEEAAA